MSEVSPQRATLGYRLGAEEGEAFWVLGMLETIKISRDNTAGQYGLVEIVVPTGLGSPWHVHPDEDEWFYVLDGEFTFYVGDARLSLPAGSFAFGPKGCLIRSSRSRPMEVKPLLASNRVCSRGSSERSVSQPPNVLCRRAQTRMGERYDVR